MLSDKQRAAHYTGVGSSTVAAILGLDQHKTQYQVWTDVTAPEHVVLPGNDTRLRLGNLFEPAICQLSAEHWGFELWPPDPELTYRHPVHHWALCHPDMLVLDRHACVEAKFRGIRRRQEYEDKDGDPLDTELVQCHWILTVTGFEAVYLCVVLGNEEVRHWRIERSEAESAYLLEIIGQWWERHIVQGEPPPATTREDVRAKWPVARQGKAIELDDNIAHALTTYRSVVGEIAHLEQMRDTAYVHIVDAIGDAEELRIGGRTVATYRQATRHDIDVKRLKAEYPIVAELCEKENSYRTLRLKKDPSLWKPE